MLGMTLLAAPLANVDFCHRLDWGFAAKNVATADARAIIATHLRGCSSVVEHLLAKEDVASSSLVTRSPPGDAFGAPIWAVFEH